MYDNGMNHPNWDRAEREHLEHRAGLDREDEEQECAECGAKLDDGQVDYCTPCDEKMNPPDEEEE